MTPNRVHKIIDAWSEIVNSIDFKLQDYKEILDTITSNDFVFLDPPYSSVENDNMYYDATLNINEFIDFLSVLNNKNVKWILTFNMQHTESILPDTLYKRKIYANTQLSTFRKLRKNEFNINECIYINY